MRILAAAFATLFVLTASSAAAQPVGTLVPPVDGAVTRHFDPPAGAYGPGHRGIDFSVASGTRVRAAASGRVSFAGRVAGMLAVTIDHGAGLETTYSELAEVWVAAGDRVGTSTWVGTAGRAHGGVAGLHVGAKLHGVYVDPALWMTTTDLGGALRLAPLLWEPSDEIPRPLAAALGPTGPGSHETVCEPSGPRAAVVTPPNDNVAIAVAGIASKTRGRDAADMYHPGPAFFGYPVKRTYLFSYRGSNDEDLHEDYARTDTYGDIENAAVKLAELVERVGLRHPGRGIDLIAHSQGGIVARSFLTSHAHHGRGRIEHFVTFASPHGGAPAAANVGHLRERTITGPLMLGAAHRAAATGLPIPDPLSPAVAQLAPGSALMEDLGRRDVAFGTRMLTLGIPNDIVVPADRTGAPGSHHRLVPPRGGAAGHSAVVTSPEGRTLAFDFLRGAPRSCPTLWDTWGPRAGRGVSFVQSKLGALVGALEGAAAGPARVVADLFGG